MDDLQQRILEHVAAQQAANSTPVSLSAIRMAIAPPPAAGEARREADRALTQLCKERLLDRHEDAGSVVRFTVTLDGWLASTFKERVEKVADDMLRLFRKRVRAGKGEFSNGAGVTGEKMVEALQKRGVLLAMMDGRIRACTHLDVSAAMIEETVGLVREIVRGA
jgi:hypothetical protein